EPCRVLGAENLIEVQKCPDDDCLVVVEVRTRQVVIKVCAEQFGIRCSTELRKGDAVCRARVRPFAGQQEPSYELAKLGPVGHSNQPGGSLALAPSTLEEDAELRRSDVVRSLSQIPHKRGALDRAQPENAPAQPKVP